MLTAPSPTGGLRHTLAGLVVAAALVVGATGCSGDTDTSATTAPPVTAEGGGGANTLATACRSVDLAPLEQAASRFAAAQLATSNVTTEEELTSALVALLDAGSALFASMATSLGDLFAALASATGQQAIADIPGDFRSAADDFSTLATDIDEAGEVTPAAIARIDEVGERFDAIDAAVEVDTEGGRELRRVPACETFIRDFEQVFADLERDAGGT